MSLSGPGLQNAASASRWPISQVGKDIFPNWVSQSALKATTIGPDKSSKRHVCVQTDQKFTRTSDSEHCICVGLRRTLNVLVCIGDACVVNSIGIMGGFVGVLDALIGVVSGRLGLGLWTLTCWNGLPLERLWSGGQAP